MSTLSVFVKDYLIIPVGMPLVAALAAYPIAQRETSVYAYAMIADTWPTLNSSTQQAIRESMREGSLTEWDYQSISKMVRDDSKVLMTSKGWEARQLPEARNRLASIIQNK